MKNDAGGEEHLVRYLLGELPEEEMLKLEESYFLDEGAFDNLQAAERELIDRYLEGRLSRRERNKFETFFLSSPARKEKLRFAKNFRRYLSARKGAGKQTYPEWLRTLASRLREVFTHPAAIPVSILLVLGLAIGIWFIFARQSPQDKILASLSKAYREERPVESRISGLDYAPRLQFRGDSEPAVDKKELDRAELMALNEVADHASAASYHSLGRIRLAERRFDDAIEELRKALSIEPNNARINSDLGAALLENARSAADPSEKASGLTQARVYLDKALELDASLLDALFNRALWYEEVPLYDKARQEWKTYLDKDGNSSWADEARQRLKDIEQKQAAPVQGKSELFDQFVAAYKAGDDQRAWQAFSKSHSRTGNAVTQRLLDDFLDLSGKGQIAEAGDSISILSYAGELESEAANDHFTKDLADFYKLTTSTQRQSLAQARGLMKAANENCKGAEYEKAGDLFLEAERLFNRAGDYCESMFAENHLGYCYLRINTERSLSILEPLRARLEDKQYKRLLAQVLNSLSDAHNSKRDFTETLECSKQSLEISKEVGDLNGVLRNLQLPILIHQQSGDYAKSTGLILSALDLAGTLSLEPQELWTFYHQAATNFCSLNYPAIAIDFQDKALELADASGMPLLKSRSLGLSGLIYQKKGDPKRAISDLQQALSEAKGITGENSRANFIGSSSLTLADIYRESGDYANAVDYYDKALDIHRKLGVDIYTFRAHKGKLLSLISMRNDEGAREEIELALPAIEEYRPKLKEETLRNDFFDLAQSIYDLSIDFTYTRLKDYEKAFNYSEASHARSLLEMVGGTVQLIDEPGRPAVRLESSTTPLTLSDVKRRLPEQSQIIQYSVLNDKIISWVISKECFRHSEQQTDVAEMDRKIRRYLELVSKRGAAGSDERFSYARELYALLIGPIEGFLDRSKQLCIVPDKVLNLVPFNALVSATGSRYFIQDHASEMAPSSSIFINCCSRAVGKENVRREKLLSVGDPAFDRGEFKRFDYLPSAAREAEKISRYYVPATTLLKENANESRVTSEMSKANVIHFAAHYITDDKSPLLSKLLLAKEPPRDDGGREPDGLLQAYEIYKINLPHARLVVLSACQTGLEQTYRGEGAISFARPFIKCGVPIVVASLWPIETNSANELMVEFHRLRKLEGLSTVEALRAAQLKLIDDPNSDYKDPYFWAPFTVIGGYATF